MRHSSYLEVNLGYLQENFNLISKKSSAKIIPMVKADAYGNGLVAVSNTLVNDCKASTLGCASLGEAISLLRSSPGLDVKMLVFSDTEITNTEFNSTYLDEAIFPVLHQPSEVNYILSNPAFKKLPIILKVNTGMNRLGITLDELEQLAPKLRGRGVRHLMTHFACSYYPLKAGDKTHRQMDEFKKAHKLLSDAGVEVEETSVANSGAIEQSFGLDETYIRPGLMLYGPPSVEPQIWNGYQVSRFMTKIIKTFEVKKGTPVGYGINVAGEDGLIAIIPVGYADLSVTTFSGTELLVNGHKAKIFGRVNMDMSFLMFDKSISGLIKVGDQVEIWGHDNKVIAGLANQMKTIPYHLMCAVTNRIPRIYKVK